MDLLFSPHAWGWTVGLSHSFEYGFVFPTRVGVDRRVRRQKEHRIRFPHTRGGGPISSWSSSHNTSFSPHAWGWTEHEGAAKRPAQVFPTRVGVDRRGFRDTPERRSFPHTRGGGPFLRVGSQPHAEFSPHAWGWTVRKGRITMANMVFPTRVGVDRLSAGFPPSPCVFPTRVGVDRNRPARPLKRPSFPHTRGGGPSCRLYPGEEALVFPTRVGVDR